MKVEVVRAVKFGGKRYQPGHPLDLTREEVASLPEGVVKVLSWRTDGPRKDGPTLEEYVEAGYDPADYPPQGFAEVPSAGLDAYRAEQQASRRGAGAGRVARGTPVTRNIPPPPPVPAEDDPKSKE